MLRLVGETSLAEEDLRVKLLPLTLKFLLERLALLSTPTKASLPLSSILLPCISMSFGVVLKSTIFSALMELFLSLSVLLLMSLTKRHFVDAMLQPLASKLFTLRAKLAEGRDRLQLVS